MRGLAVAVYGLFMGALIVYLTLGFANVRGYFCAALVAGLGLAVVAVRPGRTPLYAAGAVIGLASLTVAIWPTDGGGVCGSILNPYQAEEGLDWGPDPYSYFQRCDERAAVHAMLVVSGSAGSGLLVGYSLVPLSLTKRRQATRAPSKSAAPR